MTRATAIQAGPLRLGRWKKGRSSLEAHSEAGSLRIGNKFYVLGGFQELTRMCGRMQICDIPTGRWSYGPEFPDGFPLSHGGVASDGENLFVVSGQPGPACQPASAKAWMLRLEDMAWMPLAPLPSARYAPLLEYVNGRLHLISGATEDRETISRDHFVLRIRAPHSNGNSMLLRLEEQVWRPAPPIPEGGDHAASLVLDGKIYAIGGEHGHARMTMDASKCCGAYHVHNTLFRYDPQKEEWKQLADMPFGSSHMESQVVAFDGRIVVLGGTGEGDIFIDRAQEYDPVLDRWRPLGRLPMARKGGVAWEHRGRIYFNGGQAVPSRRKPTIRPIVADTMVCRIKHGSWLYRFLRGRPAHSVVAVKDKEHV